MTRDPREKSCLLFRRDGATVVDYLMVTALVAAVGVPIINQFFGQALLGSLQGNRQRLVQFISQSPKHTVPNAWFAIEKQGNPGGNGQLGDVGDVGGNGNLNSVGNVGGNGKLKGVGNVGGNGQLNAVGEIGGKGKLGGVGSLSGGAGAGGAGGSAAGGLGGNGLEGGGGLDSTFFNKGGEKSVPPPPDDGGGGGGRRTYRASADGLEGEEEGGDGETLTQKNTAKAPPKGENQSDKTEGEIARKKDQNAAVTRLEEEERTKAKAIDWWMVMKVLIVLLIIFLLILIALSNLKRTR